MADHYYTDKPNVESKRERISETLRGETLHFLVDRGVFSKSGIDYGSKLLIESFMPPSIPGPVVDVGCGWGPIGITAARMMPDRLIEMVDINERAIELSTLNGDLNNVKNIKVFQNDLLSDFKGQYAAIITNPPIRAGKHVVFNLYEQAYSLLLGDGELWIVIQKKQGAPSTMKKLEELGFEVEIVEKSKGYFIIKGKKC
ncbi:MULTISPECIES: class I SAM-dependent methyltransferase [Bacillaceae]|uniref:Class I SAM-dependent methyltransferase n=1 Tax=Evansella alkalicola TaxID=745819 RepID=A0ABS6JNV1_9BACI|nr:MULTISPECIES: class I SAM-dependent methyltransferase [Bacillaceae]MBU9720234.1 class I SAM-dependent methyltransferase [Bacillus alkalicola]